MEGPCWAAVIPVKRLAQAKTRLRGAAGPVPHDHLVLALVRDTVRAVRDCPLVAEVLVVTDDQEAAVVLTGLGARVVPDQPDAGLNPAIVYAASQIAGHRPVAALTADLPALRPAELAMALRAASDLSDRRGFVPDAAGTGTTMLAWSAARRPAARGRGAPAHRRVALDPRLDPALEPGLDPALEPGLDPALGPALEPGLDPRFGPDSAARHAASGAHRLTGDWPSLRRDVDTASDLAEAARLGLGPATSALWRANRG